MVISELIGNRSYGGGYQANISNSSGIFCLVCVGQAYPREPSLQHVAGQWSWLGLWLWWLVRWTVEFERPLHLWHMRDDTVVAGHQCSQVLTSRVVLLKSTEHPLSMLTGLAGCQVD